MDVLNKISGYGPGGRNCTCCGPAPKFRKKHDRTVKRRERQMVQSEIEQEIVEGVEYDVDPAILKLVMENPSGID